VLVADEFGIVPNNWGWFRSVWTSSLRQQFHFHPKTDHN
jgi:hypothetical protein